MILKQSYCNSNQNLIKEDYNISKENMFGVLFINYCHFYLCRTVYILLWSTSMEGILCTGYSKRGNSKNRWQCKLHFGLDIIMNTTLSTLNK